MAQQVLDNVTQLRTLECWLPLAQHLNDIHGWECDATTLESLVVTAAPALQDAPTVLSAQALLAHYHEQRCKEGT